MKQALCKSLWLISQLGVVSAAVSSPLHPDGMHATLTPEVEFPSPSHFLVRGATTNAIGGRHASEVFAEATAVIQRLRRLDSMTWIYVGLAAVGIIALGGVAAIVIIRKRGDGPTLHYDSSVVLQPCFEVPKGRMEEFRAGFNHFYNHINPKAERMLYYGFSVNEADSLAFCREAYQDADGVLKHLQNVDGPLKSALKIGKLVRLEAHGPAAELEKLRGPLQELDCKFYIIDEGSKLYAAKVPKNWTSPSTDKSMILRSRFKVRQGKMDEFKGMFKEFYLDMKPDAEGTLHYGWAVDEESMRVMCHESYNDAAGVLTHLENVDSLFKEALNLASLESLEVHGTEVEMDKLKSALTPLGCKFFVTDAGARTWTHKGQEVSDLSAMQILQDSAMRIVSQAQAKMEKGSRARELIETRAMGFTEKARGFIITELNNTAAALLKAIDAEEAKMLLEFNAAVEASFPPLSVLLAGVLSPTMLSLSLATHVLEFFGLFLPVFVGTSWSLYEDFGATCDIPTLTAWTWISFCLSAALTLGHGSLALKIYSGQSAMKAKGAEISARLAANTADGETGIADMQEIFIGSTVLVQEALIFEDGVRTSFWQSLIGTSTLLWMICVIWNFIIVIGWTFVPGTIAFYEAAGGVAAGHFCGAWASVFTARVVCLLTPFFFFMNIAQVANWVIVTAVHSSTVSSKLLKLAQDFDEKSLGIPVVEILVKALVLRGDMDILPARRTVALGEALRLTKEKEDLEMKLEEVQSRLSKGKDDRKALREVAKIAGDSMNAHLVLLEKVGKEDTATLKERGRRIAADVSVRVAQEQQVATHELERMANYVTEVTEEIRNSETYQSIIKQVQKTAEEAQATAAEAAVQAKAAAAAGMQKAQDGLEAGVAYAQSEEAQAAIAQARSRVESATSQARSHVEAGIAYTQSEEAQAAMSKAVASAQVAAQSAAATAQSAAQPALGRQRRQQLRA